MYPTFAQYEKASTSPEDPMPPAAVAAAPAAIPATATESEIPIRPTRKQVSRACDWCRARRIKCDNGRPCRACRQRGAQCTHKGTDEPRTLPQALREIEKLRSQIRDLQTEVNSYKSKDRQPSPRIPTPSETSIGTSPSSSREQRPNCRSSSQVASPAPSVEPKPQWEGLYVATSRSDQTSYYGPSSHFYYVSRIGAYLNKATHQTLAPRSMQPSEARLNKSVTNPSEEDEREVQPNQVSGGGMHMACMSRTQEEYFLSLYWESYYCMVPVIDETEFRKHYASLWEPGKPHRKNSPLVDVILALCLQFGYTFIPRDPSNDVYSDDATMAGRWYYRRAQTLLAADAESPTLTTVQCLIASMAYLCCASFQNMAHVTMAQAVRTAQILGLHMEPPAEMPLAERELRKRMWWLLYMHEAKTSAKLGRPIAIDRSQVTATLPSDSIEAATANGATLGSYGNVTWLTYSLQLIKLINISFDTHQLMYNKFGDAIHNSATNSLYKDSQALESCAELLASRMPLLRQWADQVPSSIKTPRRQAGEPFSIDRTPLDLDPLAPTWLARQSICLELMYHTQMINLCRPFVAFYSSASTYTPIAERHATACVNHAIAHTLIMYQATTESDFMGGWSEFFFWHWNAAITITGFILAYPIHPSTPNARRALEKAISIFDNLGTNFCVAADAGKIVRDLMNKADLLAGRLRDGVSTNVAPVQNGEAVPADVNGAGINGEALAVPDDGLAWLDPSEQNDPNYFSEFMDWALSVDQFNSFERFFDSSNATDPFQFVQ